MKLKQKSPQITRNYKLAKSSPANQSTDKPYFFAVVASIFLTSSSGSNSAPKYNAKSPVAGTVALVKNWLIVEIKGEDQIDRRVLRDRFLSDGCLIAIRQITAPLSL